jgi:DNA-binding HxlR family transcriptional regulator
MLNKENPICDKTKHTREYTTCLKALVPIRDAIDVINGKWKLQIIIAISSGNKRFKELERQIPRITARMLSKELKELEVHQLIKRTVYDTLPVSVEYTLTSYAGSLDPVIQALHEWGTLHRKKMHGIGKKV